MECHLRSAVALIVTIAMTVPIGAQDQGAPGWMRVRELAPGTPILLTTVGSDEVTRYMIAADDASMMVLNPAAIAPAARDVLSRFAQSHPDYFSAPNNRTFVLEKNVRVGPDGVFVRDRRVAGLDQIAERITRASVTAVKTPSLQRSAVGCSIAAHYGGAVVGALPGSIIGGAIGRDTGPALAGMLVGWAVGSAYVYRRCKHSPEKLIYSVS